MQNDYGTVSFRAFLESAGVEPEAIRAIECFEAEDDYRAGVKALSESDGVSGALRGDRPSLRFSSLPVAPMKRVRNGSGGGFPFSSGGIPSQTSGIWQRGVPS